MSRVKVRVGKDVRKSESWIRPCVSVLSTWIRVCSCISLSVRLGKLPFNITHSRSEMELSGVMKCRFTPHLPYLTSADIQPLRKTGEVEKILVYFVHSILF